jgi:hypothetical protein
VDSSEWKIEFSFEEWINEWKLKLVENKNFVMLKYNFNFTQLLNK